MHDGASNDRWLHTSSLMALTANTVRDKKKKPSPYVPADFIPVASRQPDMDIPEDPTALCDVFSSRAINAGNDNRKSKRKKRKESS